MSDNQNQIMRAQLIELNDEMNYFKQRNLNLRVTLEQLQERNNLLEQRILELEVEHAPPEGEIIDLEVS